MTKYVGKRIVPVHCGVWDQNRNYEMLSIVLNMADGDSYIARREVPAGTVLSDQNYWMLHSLYSQQIKDMADELAAAEKRIMADNDATEAAIRQDNELTKSHVETSLAETTKQLTGTVDSARNAMTEQKEDFDAAAERLNQRMDAVLAAGTGAGDTEIIDARVDDNGTEYESLGDHIRSIRGAAMDDAETYFSHMMDTNYASGILRNVNWNLHEGQLAYPYNWSTFSGWVSEYLIPARIIAMGLQFILKARESLISKVRISVAKDERKEDCVIFRRLMDVHIEPDAEQLLSCELPSIHFDAGQTIYISIDADVICASGFGKAEEARRVSWYTINGNLTKLENYSDGSSMRLYMTLQGYAEGEYLAKDLEKTAESHDTRLRTVESWRYLVDAFGREKIYIDQQTPFPIASVSEMYNKSTFIGWGFPAGKLKPFDTMIFRIKNRNETEYVEQVRCIIARKDKAGDILADETMTGLHIAPGEWRRIEFHFSEMIRNKEENELYAAFVCDGYISFMGGNCGVNLNPPDYGVVTYNYLPAEQAEETGVDNALRKDLSQWTDITDPDRYCETMMDVIFAVEAAKYSLGEFRDEVRDTAAEVYEAMMIDRPRVILPDVFHAVAGDTLQLFYRGIVEHPDPYFFNIEFKCDIGKNTARYFEVTPSAADAGEHMLTVNVRDNRDRILASAKSRILVHTGKKSPAKEQRVLCIGDSLTSSGTWCREAMRRLTASDGTPAGLGLSNIRFIGTKKNGECGYEGYGGWTWASYLAAPSKTTLGMWVYCPHDKDVSDQHSLWKDSTGNIWSMETIENDRIKFTRYQDHKGAMPVGTGVLTHYQNGTHTGDIAYEETVYAEGNPFWDSDESKVDFRSYCERNGFGGIDYVYTLLTWNGLGGYYPEADSSTVANHVENAKKLLRILHEQYPEARVRMMGIQMPSVNGGCGQSYGANSVYSNWYSLVRSVMGMNLAYQQMANEDEFKDFVEFINISGQFDSEFNMPGQSKAVNTRCTVMEQVGTNGVHPNTDGYYQIGDAAFRSMAADLAQG